MFLCYGTHRMVHLGVMLLPTRSTVGFCTLFSFTFEAFIGTCQGKERSASDDQVDAQRIAHYAFLHRHKLTPTQLPSANLLKLKNLFAFRERLVKNQASLKQTIKDLKNTAHLVDNKFIVRESEKQLKFVKQQVIQTEKQRGRPAIENTINEDDMLQITLRLLCSIPGIGLVTAAAVAAVALILATNNFTAFSDSRKFASYCGRHPDGVAPFEHTSGTSIRGRTKTSHLLTSKSRLY